jgi:hypothetical protein
VVKAGLLGSVRSFVRPSGGDQRSCTSVVGGHARGTGCVKRRAAGYAGEVLTSPRLVASVRVAWGAALLLAPRPVLAGVHHVRADRASLLVARVLGARQVAQGLVSFARPDPAVLALGVVVDVLHAASMVGLAAVDRGRTRGALTEAAVAGTWGGVGYLTVPRG